MTRPDQRSSELIVELIEAVRANQLATDKMDEAGGRAASESTGPTPAASTSSSASVRSAPGGSPIEAGLTTGAVTAVIDRLVEKGYVRRVADPADRRRVMVEITELMEERAGRFYAPLAEASFPALSRYSIAELEAITQIPPLRHRDGRDPRRGDPRRTLSQPIARSRKSTCSCLRRIRCSSRCSSASERPSRPVGSIASCSNSTPSLSPLTSQASAFSAFGS